MTIKTLHKSLFNVLLVFTSVMFGACSSEENIPFGNQAVSVSITLQPSRQFSSGTRATDPGNPALQENVIKKVELFLYKKGAETGEPLFYTVLTDGTANDGISYSEENTQATLTLDLPLETYYNLFPKNSDITTCTAFAITNREPENGTDNKLPDSKTIANLKALTTLYAPGFDDTYEDTQIKIKEQESFVMQGQAELTRTDRSLTGDIPVTRVAAKVSLEISKIADVVKDENNIEWEADKENVYVSFRNVMLRSHLGMNAATDEYIYTPQPSDIGDVNGLKMHHQDGKISLETPFYTYPADWRNDESCRPHIILVMNWKQKNDETKSQLTFYEVPVNDIQGYTLSNNYYRIIQEVNVLGSLEEEKPVKLNPSYIILNWGNSMSTSGNDFTNTDATISKLKYLVVDENTIEMHNTQSKQIFYFSSDPIEITSITAKHMNTSGNDATLETLTNGTLSKVSDGQYQYTAGGLKFPVDIYIHSANPDVEGDQSYISFSHELDNTMTKDADYTEYEFELTVQHIGDTKYKEAIKITQYPMIPIKAEQNSDYDDGDEDIDEKNGYVKVNNQNGNSNTNYGLYGNTNGIGNVSNKNPNRYIISVLALPDSEDGRKFIIGDPRQSNVNNLGLDTKTSTRSCPTMEYDSDTNNRKLKYYHPTDESESTKSFIAPQFMVASSYGGTSQESKDVHRQRCATYQEDGYPAGRWRLPTQAEIEYIVKLSAWGIIPDLFGDPDEDSFSYYWSANGAVGVNAYANTTTISTNRTSAAVRCVYDTWYWTDKCTKAQFTWGDKAGDL